MFKTVEECISFIENSHRTSTKSLEHMQLLCDIYGNPEKGLKYIHVAGTNGKGSVVSYLREIFYDTNINVGTFTSPYIECFNERITYNKQFISDELIIKYTNEIINKYPYLKENNIELPSFFSFITLMCFMYFRDVKPDVVILETGIGGLLDCTNVITPILSIISNVAYDHMNILGNTIEKIAINKLGIVKKNIPLVTISNDKINDLIKEICRKNNSPLTLFNKDDIVNAKLNIDGSLFDYKDHKDVKLKLAGMHQIENACLVIESCNYLHKYYNITKSNIYNGLLKTFWPGRLEIIRKDPYIILDGAHNIDGITRLHDFIKTIKKDFNKIILVLAISSNKETARMINNIEKDVDEIIFTSFNYKRSEDYNILYQYSNHPNKQKNENVDELALSSLNNNDNKVLWIFSGSLYFVSQLRKIFKSL